MCAVALGVDHSVFLVRGCNWLVSQVALASGDSTHLLRPSGQVPGDGGGGQAGDLTGEGAGGASLHL